MYEKNNPDDAMPSGKSPMKDAIELHYGKCAIHRFWILTHTRD